MANGGNGARTAVSRVLAVLFSVCAFVGVVLVYRHAFHVDEQVAEEQQHVEEVAQPTQDEDDGYDGVEDPWIEGNFSTGNRELDGQVKAFCDALTQEGLGVTGNAQRVYNQVVWSTFLARGADDYALGPDWDVAAARQYFSLGDPEHGVGGGGDNYEFSAVTAFCLRYFGFTDAVAAPIVTGAGTESEGASALVLVSNEYGLPCVCDPAYGANGWMTDRDLYTITIDDAGEDTSYFESMGYTIRSRTV